MLRRFALLSLASLLGLLLAAPHLAWAQTITINEARNEPLGTEVTVEGTVTRAFGSFARIQDASGPTGASGIVIRQTFGDQSEAFQNAIADGDIEAGTVLRVTGSTSEFNGLLQINNTDLVGFEITGSGDAPAPQAVTLETLQSSGEDYESELVRIGPLSFSSASGTFNFSQTYTVENIDGTTLDLRVQRNDETDVGDTPIPQGGFTFVGVVGEFNASYQLIPVFPSDFLPAPTFRLSRIVAVANEGTEVSVDVEAVNLSEDDTFSATASYDGGTATPGTDVTGFDDPTTLTFSGPDPAPQTLTFNLAADGDDEGVEQVQLALSSNDVFVGQPDRFTLWVRDDSLAQTTLFAGQTGTELLTSLQDTFGDPETLGYDDTARDTLYGRVFNRDGVVRTFYTGADVPLDPSSGDPTSLASSAGINTEHLWPRSKGSENEPALSNIHILAPTLGNVNSLRSNYAYGEIDDAEANRWYADRDSTLTPPPPLARDAWTEFLITPTDRDERRIEPREAVKGDVARAMFYFDAIYRSRADQAFFAQQDTTLLQWHLADPADADEVLRTIQIGNYQSKKINPFVIDPTLVDRLYGFGDVAPAPVTQLRATLNVESVRLDWQAKAEDDVAAYRIYRAAAPDVPDPSQTPVSVVDAGGGTAYVDTGLDASQTYTYRITAVDTGGNESDLSNGVEASPLSATVTAEVTSVFGDPSEPRNYRLVAVPGAANVPLDQTLDGAPGDAWQAYWDDGSDFVAFDGSDTFTLQPGRGFWLLGNEAWTVNQTFDAVELSDAGTYPIPVHDGWNILSNPFDVDVDWRDVQALNPSSSGEGSAVSTLWLWSGGFVPASIFESATSGRAYYAFVEDGQGEIVVPYPGAAPEGSDPVVPAALRLTASVDGTPSAVVEAGLTPDARDGLDAFDEAAPRSRFQPATLHWTPPVDAPPATSAATSPATSPATSADAAPRLAREFRAPDAHGHTFDLTLQAEPGQPVTLAVSGRDAFDGQRVVLVDRTTGRSYDLDRASTVRLVPTASTTSLQVLAGSDAFVRAEESEIRPEQTRLLPAYPNPFAERTTVEYTLTEATDVHLSVYDLLGRRVAVLDQGRRDAGFHRVEWTGGTLASGMYLLRLDTDGQRFTRKLVHIR